MVGGLVLSQAQTLGQGQEGACAAHQARPRPLLVACALSGWPGGTELAASIFESLVKLEAFDYKTLMRSHVGGGHGDREPATALCLYVDMLEAGVEPNSYMFSFVLKSCTQLVALQEGRQVTASART